MSFQKRFTKRLAKVPEPIRTKAVSQDDVFRADPFDPRLNNHALQGGFAWLSSINVTWDFRAIFRDLSGGAYEFVEFVDLGTHSRPYGK